jgi:hypothetical protein
MWIGKDVIRSFHDQFEVLFGLEQMRKDAVLTKFEVLWGMEQMIKDAVMTQFEVICGLERVWKEAFTTNLRQYVDWNRYGWIQS